VERSLAAIPAGRSTRESLAGIADPDVGGTLAHLGSAPTERGEETDHTASNAVGEATSDGQRFRILRPHARGGLGAVFVALDSELHREVALKQILDRHADDPASRQRFVLEAEFTGGLEHPGIVPVYGLGTYGDGHPYYAMRFIRGDSLKEAIAHFHADESLKNDPAVDRWSCASSCGGSSTFIWTIFAGTRHLCGHTGLVDVGMDAPLIRASNGRTRRLTGRPLRTEPFSELVKLRLMRASWSRRPRSLVLLIVHGPGLIQ
jgi:hypothetical protein